MALVITGFWLGSGFSSQGNVDLNQGWQPAVSNTIPISNTVLIFLKYVSLANIDPKKFKLLHAIHIDGEAHLLLAFRAIDL